MRLSQYAKEIEICYMNTNKNIFISASAGSGKTTTSVHLAKITPTYKKILFLAFNRSIVDELEVRVPKHVEVRTIHGKACSVLKSSKIVKWKISENKNFGMLIKVMDPRKFDNKHKLMNTCCFDCCKLYDLVRLNLIDINDDEAIIEVGERWGLLVGENELLYTRKLYQLNEKAAEKLNDSNGKIDFLDMLWLAYTKVDPNDFPKYDVVFCDESQDISPLQRELILRMIKRNGRLITVGDFSQAIYSFQGASTDSFRFFMERENTEVLKLPISYRCAKNIVLEARPYTDHIEWRDGAPDGIVRMGKMREIKSGDMVICRNNKPLIELFIYLLKNGIKSRILGRNFGSNLISMMEKYGSVYELELTLDGIFEDLKGKGVRNPRKNNKYVAFDEKLEIIKILVNHFGGYQMAINQLNNIFTDERSDDEVTLSTIHKSKGLENERVFILGFHELMPSEFAVTDLELEAEKCLQFVAITRAKDELIYIPYMKGLIDEEKICVSE